MAKRILFPVFEFFCFLALMFVGGNWDAVNLGLEVKAMQNHVQPHILFPTLKMQAGATHIFIANGLVFAAVLLVIILIVQAIRKRMRPASIYTAIAFFAAVVLGLLMKMGLPPSS